MLDNYSKLSYTLTNLLDKTEKKQNGIYFTSRNIINNNLELLKPYMLNIKYILEPSCGSCEYILRLHEINNTYNITGIEINKKIYNLIKDYFIGSDNIKICNDDFISFNTNIKYDLIIGNPPYLVLNKKNINKKYNEYFEGRPNLFILFILKSLELLNEYGILSFVLPKNFLNCLYYNKTRKYINQNYEIINIVNCDKEFIDTQQDTIIFIIRNCKENKNNIKYVLEKDNYIIFGTIENIISLKNLYNNSTTLNNLGFNVCVGNITWNECKKELTDDNTKTLLIYSSNIKDKNLKIEKFNNNEKKNYINRKGMKEPLLIINRGYGVGNYKFDYCLINETNEIEYLIENHLICIKRIEKINKEDLIILYKKIIKSFEDKRTLLFIKNYFGNNAINTSELCNILPIFDS